MVYKSFSLVSLKSRRKTLKYQVLRGHKSIHLAARSEKATYGSAWILEFEENTGISKELLKCCTSLLHQTRLSEWTCCEQETRKFAERSIY